MDAHSVAIEQGVAFGVGSRQLAVGASPEAASAALVAVSEETFDAAAPDIALCRLATGGNIAAFELLYERYHRRTYSLTLRMTSSQTEAEDLTQEVFIQLFRKIGSFRGDSAFTTWLHRMTVNQVLMHFRKRTVKYEKTTEEGETPVQVVSGSTNPHRMQIVDKIALESAIEQLPDGYKNVFVLHDVEGFEHEEVARILGCSVGTSKSQLHKARLKLQKLLKKKANPRLVGLNA